VGKIEREKEKKKKKEEVNISKTIQWFSLKK
jgi:hypothetical protein